jgi:hypothetical protein
LQPSSRATLANTVPCTVWAGSFQAWASRAGRAVVVQGGKHALGVGSRTKGIAQGCARAVVRPVCAPFFFSLIHTSTVKMWNTLLSSFRCSRELKRRRRDRSYISHRNLVSHRRLWACGHEAWALTILHMSYVGMHAYMWPRQSPLTIFQDSGAAARHRSRACLSLPL